MIFGMVVLVSNLRVLIISSDHSVASIISIICSISAYYICFLIASNIMFQTANLYGEMIPLFSSPNFHFGNILIIGFTSMMDLGLEWHRRWRDNNARKQNYIEKLESDLLMTEDDIVFVPNEINYQHTLQEPRFTIQNHV